MFKTIAVPLDGSRCAEHAFEVALSIAKTEKAALAVCSVVDPIVIVGTTPPSPAVDILLSDRENEARHLVTAALEKAAAEGLKATGEMHLGVPFDEILRFAKRAKADVIVMGTHGRTGIKRLFLGSVAESVLRGAHCPVIIVKDAAAEHKKTEAPSRAAV